MTQAEAIIAIVDDDEAIREGLSSLIWSVGLRVQTFVSATEFLHDWQGDAHGCIVLDVHMPRLSGLDLQRELADANIHTPIIFVTGHGDIPMTVRAMKAGGGRVSNQALPRAGLARCHRAGA